MSNDIFPLGPGDTGDAVRDLQRRLSDAGFPVHDRPGDFGDDTSDAVRRFQVSRGLETDGYVGHQTWTALIEAAFRLGDRLLYLRSPMYRGDDVASLQRRLGSLGFNAGRVDGVFGPDTAGAVEDFQRNIAVTTDAVVGPETLAALSRVSGRSSGQSVATVLEAETLRFDPPELAGARVVIGDFGGAAALVGACARLLSRHGAVATTVSGEDATEHAGVANSFGAIAYVGISIRDTPACRALYFSTEGYESVGGRQLAQRLALECGTVLDTSHTCEGMRLPVLRATKMPAVVCRIGPPERVVRSLGDLADSVARSVETWVVAPLEGQGSQEP
jgi:N-acetylmuramoyl-L-alanine amidase